MLADDGGSIEQPLTQRPGCVVLPDDVRVTVGIDIADRADVPVGVGDAV